MQFLTGTAPPLHLFGGDGILPRKAGRFVSRGATEDEIFEAVQCLIFPAGGPSLMMGIKCLRAVLEERKT